MKTASWVIREKTTKKVIMETFDERKVRALNKAKYEAVPIMEYLQEFNRSVKENPMKRKKSHKRNPSASRSEKFCVYLNGREIDSVYYKGMTAEEVKRSLISHDGYDPRITVKKASTYKRNPARKSEVDKHAATELVLYTVNDGQLYRSKTTAIILNLARKSKKGVYNIDLAVKLWEYLAKDAALKYMKEFGSRGDKVQDIFNAATRHEAAKQFEQEYREEVIEKAKNL